MPLRPGTDTGSAINAIYSRMTRGAPEPEIGMGATLLHWTDRTAATVIAWDPPILTVREDTATVVAGSAYDGSAVYAYTENTQGTEHSFRCDKNGAWAAVRRNPATGRWKKTSGPGLIVGFRREYRDPSF